METNSAVISARAFARNLNILLKTVRLYGFNHDRSAALYEAAWTELRAALHDVGDAGLLLGVSGSKVLLDGVPLEPRPTDRSFAQLLSAAGLSSIHFSSRVTSDDFSRFVRAFATRGPKTGPLATVLKAALAEKGEPTIRVNEIRFVAQDAALAESGMAAELAARSLGDEIGDLQDWLNAPQKLLQLIAAAEGARRGTTSPQTPAGTITLSSQGGTSQGGTGQGGPGQGGIGQGGAGQAGAGQAGADGIGGTASSGTSSPQDRAGSPTSPESSVQISSPQEEDVVSIIRLLGTLGQAGSHPKDLAETNRFYQQLKQLPPGAQLTLTEALNRIAAVPPAHRDTPVLLQLAETIAIRFALERFERGETRVNAVVELLDRLKREIKSLRKILKLHEDKMSGAGLEVESHADVLDRQFWAGLPESVKRKILHSPEAWAIPPRNIRQFVVDELLARADSESAKAILLNYATCVHDSGREARRKTALGLTDLADLYIRSDSSLLQAALRHVAEQLHGERDAELQTLLSASFVRLSHEAADHHDYKAIQQAMASLEQVEQHQPFLAQLLWPRIRVRDRLPEFIEEGLAAPRVPEDLMEVLRRVPQAAIEESANRFGRCTRRDECDRLVTLVHELGPEGVVQLRKTLINRPPQEAAYTVALLSRLEPKTIEELLPGRLREWDRIYHDQVVRQLACSGAPERGRLLVNLLDALDPVVLPETLDEIGMSGDQTAAPRLSNIVEEELQQDGNSFLGVKAIEALGRLRSAKASPLLRPLVEAKQVWRWRHPRELRITAAQALRKIDPEWARSFLPKSGLSGAELKFAPLDPVPAAPWLRQRRYERIQLSHTLTGVAKSPQGDCRIAIEGLSLGGGVGTCQRYLRPCTLTRVELRSGLSRIHAEAIVRDVRPQQVSFELVKIGLEDRSRLRRPLAGH